MKKKRSLIMRFLRAMFRLMNPFLGREELPIPKKERVKVLNRGKHIRTEVKPTTIKLEVGKGKIVKVKGKKGKKNAVIKRNKSKNKKRNLRKHK